MLALPSLQYIPLGQLILRSKFPEFMGFLLQVSAPPEQLWPSDSASIRSYLGLPLMFEATLKFSLILLNAPMEHVAYLQERVDFGPVVDNHD